MSKQLIDIVLPNLAKQLRSKLRRYQAGKLSDAEFAQDFTDLLQKQFSWLAEQGLSDTDAVLTIHAALVVLSQPGLRIEAAQRGLPLEIVERQAVRTAAADLAKHYEVDEAFAFDSIAEVVAHYGE